MYCSVLFSSREISLVLFAAMADVPSKVGAQNWQQAFHVHLHDLLYSHFLIYISKRGGEKLLFELLIFTKINNPQKIAIRKFFLIIFLC